MSKDDEVNQIRQYYNGLSDAQKREHREKLGHLAEGSDAYLQALKGGLEAQTASAEEAARRSTEEARATIASIIEQGSSTGHSKMDELLAEARKRRENKGKSFDGNNR